MCTTWLLLSIAYRWLTVKKTMIRFRHKQMPLPVTVIVTIKPLLKFQLAVAIEDRAMDCVDGIDDGQHAMTLPMTAVALVLRLSAYP